MTLSVSSAREGGDLRALPALADGVQLLGEMQGSGYRRPPALVRRADGQTITLTPLLYLTLKALDGQRGYQGAAEALSHTTGRLVTPDDVSYLVEQKLRPLGLLVEADGSQPETTKRNPLLALKLKFVITNRDMTRRLTSPFARLFNRTVVTAVLAGFLAISWYILIDKGLASAVHQAFYEPGMILGLWVLVVASAAFHEFGHAAACRYGGATPGAMGAGLYLVWPAFYTDVTDSYRLGRGGRLRVDLGGLYFNAIFAIITMGAWAILHWDALLLVVAAQHMQMVRQLAPFIRADGYHIVADLTGVPDLFAHIKPTLQSFLPRHWRPAHPPQLKRWARAVVALWVLTMVPVLAALLAAGVLLLPRVAATAWDSMNIQWDAVGYYWGEVDLLGVLVRSVASVIVLLPVLGLLYILFRIARRTAKRVWAATEDNRAGRAAAVLAGVAIASAVAYAWLPSSDRYEPIKADEGGTLSDLVRIEDQRIFIPLLERGPAALRAAPADTVSAGSLAPSTSAVTAVRGRVVDEQSTLATVGPMTSAGTATGVMAAMAASDIQDLQGDLLGQIVTEQVWPFPFPPPEDPDPGDNRAWAVNTVDGSVVKDLAVSWAIVTANEITERNEAWALASCEDCQTIAAAFQVLLIMTDAEVVTPENVAAAANYECTNCTTEAIAVQLIVSITGMPSEEAMAAIDEKMQTLALLEDDLLDEISSDELYYLFLATEAEIMQILADDGVLPDMGLVDGSTSTTGSTADTSTTELAASPTAGPTPDATGTATATESPTATASSEPTATSTSTDGSTATSDPTVSSEPTTTTTSEPTDTTSPSPTPEPTPSPTPDPSPTADPTTTTSP